MLVAGGGTGGHVMPIVNVIQTINAGEYPAHRIYRYGSSSSLEYTMTQKINQTLSNPVYFRGIISGKVRRDRSLRSWCRNIRDMIKVVWGTLQALWYLRRDSIDVIWCKGGYVAGPVIFAARVWGIPLIVHESDTKMGLINRLASRHAKAIFTAFDKVHPDAQVIGQLLSDDVAKEFSRRDFIDLIGNQTSASQTHILVMGGSQGSQSLYQSLAQAMRMRPDIYRAYTFVVIGGILSKDVDTLFSLYDNVIVLDFLTPAQLTLCYQYCDIALTRAGTTSLAEQKLRDMLLIMVPIPRTHDQSTNAQRYVEHYGDIMIKQNETLPYQFDKVFTALRAYSKTITHDPTSRLHVIQQPKEKIIQTLFSFSP